jgi:hypothetical protein
MLLKLHPKANYFVTFFIYLLLQLLLARRGVWEDIAASRYGEEEE